MMPALQFRNLPGAVPVRAARVNAAQWREAITAMHAADARLLALWGDDARDRGAGFGVHAVVQETDRLTLLDLAVDPDDPVYPALDAMYPFAERMQRAIADLLGVHAEPRTVTAARSWLRHDAWGETEHPLRRDYHRGEPP